ncbi:hypothetical protein ACGFJ5_04885 [Micromonospora echinaurantiaca]
MNQDRHRSALVRGPIVDRLTYRGTIIESVHSIDGHARVNLTCFG